MPVSVRQERDYTEAWRAIGPVLSQAGIDPPAYDLSGRLLFLEDGPWHSTSSFVRAPVPRATALLLRFAQLRRRLNTSRHPPIQTAT